MSTPLSERKRNKLDVAVKALDLMNHTVKVTSNEKIFIPKYKEHITDEIIETAKRIYFCIWEANNIRVTSREDWGLRNRLERRAAAECNHFLSLIDIAESVFHLRARKVDFWAGKIITVRTMIKSWNDSDSKRYSNLKE